MGRDVDNAPASGMALLEIKSAKPYENEAVETLKNTLSPAEILLIDPVIPGINDSITTLGMLLQLAKDQGIRMVDHRDLKCQLQNGSYEYFYKELRKRNREVAKQLEEKFGEEMELVPENHKELMRHLIDTCAAYDIICDKKEILAYRRQYSNQTEGTQLTFDF